VADASITVEVLPAGYGDCLVLSCPVKGGVWRLLVDTGPDEAWPRLRARLAALPPSREGKRHIDLAVISHIDHDHIGAARLLFADRELRLSFGDIWFNARPHTATRGVAEGEGLASLLGDAARALPWNRAFAGNPVVTPGLGQFVELPAAPATPSITVLSPEPVALAKLAKTWDKELARLKRREQDEEPLLRSGSDARFPDLEALAGVVSPTDKAPANGSSIAILVEHRGASIVLAADAFAPVLEPALRSLAEKRGVGAALRVDAFKISHHGSRANLTAGLLTAVTADHYIVSTNNAVFGLPNDEALARIVLNGGHMPTLWFNYRTEMNARWADPELQSRHRFMVRLPPQGEEGITLVLGSGS
jgi:beta-lactamase superfamily II metal-dependent hydrolase